MNIRIFGVKVESTCKYNPIDRPTDLPNYQQTNKFQNLTNKK